MVVKIGQKRLHKSWEDFRQSVLLNNKLNIQNGILFSEIEINLKFDKRDNVISEACFIWSFILPNLICVLSFIMLLKL